MRRNPRVAVALALGVLIALLSVLAPLLATHDPRATSPQAQLQSPSREHLLGTDLLGRDVYSRVLYGGRRTFGVALLTALITLGPGLLIGAMAGFAGGWIDTLLMTLLDALLAVPPLVLALALVTLLGSGSVQIAVAVGIAGIPPYGRVTRAAVLEARSRPFVEAARAIGARPAGNPDAAHSAHDCADVARVRGGDVKLGDPEQRGADLPRLWRRHLRAGLGCDAGGRAAGVSHRAVGGAGAGSRPQRDGAGDQLAGGVRRARLVANLRRAARRRARRQRTALPRMRLIPPTRLDRNKPESRSGPAQMAAGARRRCSDCCRRRGCGTRPPATQARSTAASDSDRFACSGRASQAGATVRAGMTAARHAVRHCP